MSELEPLVSAYAELYSRLMRLLDRQMAEQGASLARTKILLRLEKRGPLRATNIAEFFSLSPRTVTEAIDALEREGLLERQPDPSDRRAKLIHLTEKGRAAVNRTAPIRHQIIAQTFGVLDERERAQMLEMLQKVAAQLPDIPQDGCSG